MLFCELHAWLELLTTKVGIPYLSRQVVIEISLSSWKGSEKIGPCVILTSSKTQTYLLTYLLSFLCRKNQQCKIKTGNVKSFLGLNIWKRFENRMFFYIKRSSNTSKMLTLQNSKGKTVNPVFLNTTKFRIWYKKLIYLWDCLNFSICQQTIKNQTTTNSTFCTVATCAYIKCDLWTLKNQFSIINQIKTLEIN